MTTERQKAKLRVIAEVHDAWARRHTPSRFVPRHEGSDYNVETLDVEATAAQEDELQRETQAALAAAGLM